MKRRALLALLATGGCLRLNNQNDAGATSDSSGNEESATPTPTDSPTLTPTDSPTPTPTDSPTPTPTETPTPTPSPLRGEFTDDVTIRHGDRFKFYEFDFPAEVILQWRIENLLGTDQDFDVFLFTEPQFTLYRRAVQNDEGGSPEYIIDGSAEGIETSARGTVTLPAGTYYLVIDNTDVGDAGDFGEQDTRRVRIRVESRPA